MQTTQFEEEMRCSRRDRDIEDGRLMKVDEYLNIPVYATLSCFFVAGLYQSSKRCGVIQKAVEALRRPDANDGCCQKLRVLPEAEDYECLWVVQDEERITLMFPEDR